MRRVLVTGSRNWFNHEIISDALHAQRLLDPDYAITVVHGGAAGADALAAWWARSVGVHAEVHMADWSLGKVAGHIRNQKMVDLGADVCLAFPMQGSRGTWDCVRRAEKAGIPVRTFHIEAPPRQGLRADHVVMDEAYRLF